jgi:serine O-acetyltransferase
MKITDLYSLVSADASRRNISNVTFFVLKSTIRSGDSAVILYRLQSYLATKSNILAKCFSRLNLVLNGIEFVLGSEIGPGLVITHPVGIVVGNKVKAGANLLLMQGVSLGQLGFDNSREALTGNPQIGDNVSVGASAIILGKVLIGDNCIVGAGAVVLKNVPSGFKAIGNPAELSRIK